jgi:hypothetical protein
MNITPTKIFLQDITSKYKIQPLKNQKLIQIRSTKKPENIKSYQEQYKIITISQVLYSIHFQIHNY